MQQNEYHHLHKTLSKILASGVDISVKLKHEAEQLHLKLEKELDIRNFIASVAHVDNYKTIRRSEKILLEKLARAEQLGIKLDETLVQQVNQCSSRLIAERDLRFEMDNTNVMTSTDETIGALQDLIQNANDKGVEDMYM